MDKGNDYTVQSSDYVYTYSSVASRDEQEDLGLNLKYQSAKDSQKGVYTYIVITKIKNKSSVPIYAFVPESGEDKYVAPENSFTYKLDEDYKTLDGLNSEKYIVFTMSLADKTKSIDAAEFVFPIVITKDILILPEDTDEVQKVGHLAAYEVANIQTVQTKVELSSTPATIDIPFLTLATAEIDYMLLNFHIKQRAQALPENIQLSFSISAVSGTMSCTSYVNEVMVFNGSYKDIVECLENLAQNLTVTGSLSGDVYTVNIPTNRFAIDGTANFTMIVSTQPYGLAEMMYGYGFTDVQYQLTSSVTGIETIVETENVEWNITDYYKIGNVYSITTQNEDILQSMGFAYSLSNYQIRKLDDTIEKISISISSKNAEAMFILTGGIKHSLTINEIYAMGEDPNLITVGLLKDVAQVNLPITLNQEGLMDFCVCVLYNAEQVKQGNDVSVTLSTSYETKEDQQPTNLSYVLAVDGNNKLFYDVVGMIDQTQSTVTIPAY
ncbi:MAG: hypothetical protein J6Q51_04850, partial [Clostridia bacterium]|nr:hypothetical protein [Clostridia bacterium]